MKNKKKGDAASWAEAGNASPMLDMMHPGFKKVQKKIAQQEGMPMENAGAILAASSRKASAKAKKRNPRLNKVKGGKTK
jgi:hypothetical protein